MNGFIEHTLLKPQASASEVAQLCNDALLYNFHAVCVNPCHVKACKDILKNSTVKVCTVIGFPLGANLSRVKVFEAEEAILDGADELDMVMNIGALKSGNIALVQEDIHQVANITQLHKKPLKVIIETALLSQQEKIQACTLILNTKADFVKTCTGFSGGAASVQDIQLIRSIVGPKKLIKASGGIKTKQIAESLLQAGANRLGTSSGPSLLQEMHPVP
eukprot:Sdes_comp15110_c0_seq1m3914